MELNSETRDEVRELLGEEMSLEEAALYLELFAEQMGHAGQIAEEWLASREEGSDGKPGICQDVGH
jgi:hypothetical protein